VQNANPQAEEITQSGAARPLSVRGYSILPIVAGHLPGGLVQFKLSAKTWIGR
jgi:hypothetical protein